VSAMGQPTQPSIPPGSAIAWITMVETTRRQIRPWAAYSCLVAGQVRGRQVRLYTRSVCDTKAPLHLLYAACGVMRLAFQIPD